MFQDRLDDLPVFDEADDPHDSPTLRTDHGIGLVDLLDQPGPVFPVFLGTFIGFQDARDPILFVFFPFSPGDPAKRGTVVPIVPYSRQRRDSPLSGMWEHPARGGTSHSKTSKTFSLVPSFAR